MKKEMSPSLSAPKTVLLAISAALVAGATSAQEAAATPEIQTISQLAHLIRWRGVLFSLIVVVGALILLRFVDNVIIGLSLTFADKRMALQKGQTILHFIVYVAVFVAAVLLSFHVSNEVLAVLGGTVAVGLGFAVKDLVASVVAGVMIMVDRPFQVGDRVSFGGQYGDITSIGLRSVRLQTLDDNTVTIPNNKFLTDITSCGNYGALDMQVVIDFHIGVDQNIKLARQIVTEAAVSSRYVYLSKPVVVLVSQGIVERYIAVQLRCKVYVLDTQYEKALVDDITMRVLDRFAEIGIEPPAILHRSVGNTESGGAADLRLAGHVS